MVFLRFHEISDDIQKRGRRSTYSFDLNQSQCGIRASQMLNLDKAILPKEFRFRETGKQIQKTIKLEKMGFDPSAAKEDDDEDEEKPVIIKVIPANTQNLDSVRPIK